MPKCTKKGCAGLTFGEPGCEGSDDEQGMYHCVHCGVLEWVDKGNACDRCGAYWCTYGWQTTFIYPDCENVETDIGGDEGICTDCFLAKPELWCTDDACDCDQKESKVRATYGKFLAGGVNCASIELCKDEEYYCVEVCRFPENDATALLCVIEDGQRREQVFGGANAVDYACTEARRLAKEKLEHGFVLKRGKYGFDGTYGYLTGFQ